MNRLPYELELALGQIINHDTSSEYEIQDIIFLLHKHEKLTWEEIEEKRTYQSTSNGDLEEAIRGLWVVGFIEKDEEGEYTKIYELSLFGRRLLDNLLSTLFTV